MIQHLIIMWLLTVMAALMGAGMALSWKKRRSEEGVAFYDRLYGMKFVYYEDPNDADAVGVPLTIGLTTGSGVDDEVVYLHAEEAD